MEAEQGRMAYVEESYCSTLQPAGPLHMIETETPIRPTNMIKYRSSRVFQLPEESRPGFEHTRCCLSAARSGPEDSGLGGQYDRCSNVKWRRWRLPVFASGGGHAKARLKKASLNESKRKEDVGSAVQVR